MIPIEIQEMAAYANREALRENPDTQKEAVKPGEYVKNEKKTLTLKQKMKVIEMDRLKIPKSDIAEKFGVTPPAIYHIVKYRNRYIEQYEKKRKSK